MEAIYKEVRVSWFQCMIKEMIGLHRRAILIIFMIMILGILIVVGVLSLIGFFNPGVSNYESFERKMDWRARWERLTCPFRGGTWERWPGFCVITYKDGGKICRDSDECEGRCRGSFKLNKGELAIGECDRTSDTRGCQNVIEDGRAGYSYCAD